jgi:hypothetical protein
MSEKAEKTKNKINTDKYSKVMTFNKKNCRVSARRLSIHKTYNKF